MILAAGLLVLAGLGLFVGGLATGTTSWYWGCVACCAVAAVLLIAVRLRPAPRVAAAERRSADDRRADAARSRASSPSRGAAAAGAASAPAPGDGGSGGRHARHAAPEGGGEGAAPVGTGTPARAEPTAEEVPAAAVEPAAGPPAAAARQPAARAADDGGDPAEEDVEVTDLLLVVDLRDQVLVVDEHPRYHLTDCRWLRGRPTIPLPVSEARSDGFTPCAVCRPDSHLADIARARKAAST